MAANLLRGTDLELALQQYFGFRPRGDLDHEGVADRITFDLSPDGQRFPLNRRVLVEASEMILLQSRQAP